MAERSSIIVDKIAKFNGSFPRRPVGSGSSRTSSSGAIGPAASSSTSLGNGFPSPSMTPPPPPPTGFVAELPAGGVLAPIERPAEDGNPETRPFRPPPYSSPSIESLEPPEHRRSVPKGPQSHPGLPTLDYHQYSPPLFELSPDTTTITSKATYLSTSAQALAAQLRSLSTVPPKVQVLVQGGRNRKTDFSIRLSLLHLLVPEKAQDRMEYLRCVGSDELAYRGAPEPALEPDLGAGGSVEAWCQRFVEDAAPVKSFTMERVVANLDTEWLELQFRSLVASTGYRGVVSVAFPVTHARVTVHSPPRSNKFVASVTTLFSRKARYEVVRAVWPFADRRHGEPGRRCAIMSERAWWEEWRDPINYAVATRRHGWVTNEDKLECIMESKGKGVSLVDWGPDESAIPALPTSPPAEIDTAATP